MFPRKRLTLALAAAFGLAGNVPPVLAQSDTLTLRPARATLNPSRRQINR